MCARLGQLSWFWADTAGSCCTARPSSSALAASPSASSHLSTRGSCCVDGPSSSETAVPCRKAGRQRKREEADAAASAIGRTTSGRRGEAGECHRSRGERQEGVQAVATCGAERQDGEEAVAVCGAERQEGEEAVAACGVGRAANGPWWLVQFGN